MCAVGRSTSNLDGDVLQETWSVDVGDGSQAPDFEEHDPQPKPLQDGCPVEPVPDGTAPDPKAGGEEPAPTKAGEPSPPKAPDGAQASEPEPPKHPEASVGDIAKAPAKEFPKQSVKAPPPVPGKSTSVAKPPAAPKLPSK